MPALDMSVLSLALLAAAAVAFTRQRKAAMLVCGGAFVPTVVVATVSVFWSWSAAFTVALLAVLLGLPLLTLFLFWVDMAFAPFCIQMTYPGMLCWVFWPALLCADFLGLLARFLGVL